MLRLTAAAPMLALMLAGCDDGAAPRNVRSVKTTSEYIEGLKRLGELNRGLALRRAIQDSGSRCKKVDASAYQQDYQNLSMWAARCSDTGEWALFIAPNGDVQVRKCTETGQLGLPGCRFPAAD